MARERTESMALGTRKSSASLGGFGTPSEHVAGLPAAMPARRLAIARMEAKPAHAIGNHLMVQLNRSTARFAVRDEHNLVAIDKH
jgi:hypothetical protein